MENLHVLSLFLPAFFLLSCSIPVVSQCLDAQRSALLQLQQGLYYSHNFTLSSKSELWDVNTDCCSWKGVTCDALGHVIGLDLSYRGLSGNFQSVFNLHHLRRLNLARNNFNSTLFSSQFDKLPNLTHLNLSKSCFYGQIPKGISSLTRLVSLDLSNQDYCYKRNEQSVDLYNGYFPTLKLEKPNFKTLIKNMKSLTELYLDRVNISSQSTEWCQTTSLTLPNLRVLSLSDCGLAGSLCSSLSKLHFLSKLNLNHNPISYLPPNFLKISSRLVSLNLSSCNLSGHFPTEVFLLLKMQSIDISQNHNLKGQLPTFPLNNTLKVLSLCGTNFSGKLPESLGNVKFLTKLDLSLCNFSGQIPSTIANLTNLVHLNLEFNNFSGLIPPFHGSGVPNLAYLNLQRNRLSGPVHSSIFTLPSLHTLLLGGNQLVGEIDEFPNASCSLMQYLDLSHNYLRGSIPKSIVQLPRLELLSIGYNSFGSMKLDMLSQLKNLRTLDLSNVSLSIGNDNKNLSFPQLEELSLESCNLTEIPEFIKTQAKLVSVDLSNNRIHGLVPNWVWKSTLLRLNLSFNEIDLPRGDANSSIPMLRSLYIQSCNKSTYPEISKGQENSEFLNLSNNKISGAVPNRVRRRSLDHVSLPSNHLSYLDQVLPEESLTSSQGSICNLTQLKYFSVSNNKLSGSIPNCLGNISTLSFLQLGGNNFTGMLPRSLAKCTQLEVLDVGNNKMHDTFPFWLKKLPTLKVLILRKNRFFGQIKYFEQKTLFPALDVLDIASNEFSGEVSLDFLQATQLRSLKIGENKLEGKLPRSLANCTKLEVLDIGKNMIHDTFPFWLGKLPSLKVLILRSNRFYGTIQFSEAEKAFSMLHILDLASNKFSGDLPTQFWQCLKAMMLTIADKKAKPEYIGDEYYHDSVTIVNKGNAIFYEKILDVFTCLDLSNNGFHGRIPEEIRNLISLKVLNLSQNSFSGHIPLGLENLKELESLDFSLNKLSGKIPPQLTSLTFLEALNLSYNQLEGIIPQSNQFSTFLSDSYQGNPRLCGPPLTRNCYEVGVPLSPPEEDADSLIEGISDWKIVLIGYGCGLVIGLCIGYTVLNEMGNKWLDSFKGNDKRKRKTSR